MTIYEELCKVMRTKEMDHWGSDLYVKVTPESKRIVIQVASSIISITNRGMRSRLHFLKISVKNT